MTTTTIRRAATYSRKSTTDAKNPGKSVADQKREAEAEVARRGWTLIDSLADDGISASRYARGKTRPKFTKLVELVESKRIDAIVIAEQSRLTRDLGTLAQLVELCANSGTVLVAGGSEVDLSEPSGLLLAGITGVVDATESARISKRTLRGKRGAALAGRPAGSSVYGYRRTYDPQSGALLAVEIDECQAEVLRDAVRRVQLGDSLVAIVRDLNDRGVPGPTGTPWQRTALRRLLLSPTIAGRRVHRGRDVGRAMWEPIISERDLEVVTAKLTDPMRTTTVSRPGRIGHLLSSILRCGVCGGRVRVMRDSYMCSTGHVTVSKKVADEYVTELVLARVERPDFLTALTRDDDDAEVRAEVEALEARKRNIMAAVGSGAFSIEDASIAVAVVDADLVTARAKLTPVETDPTLTAIAGSGAREYWAELGLHARVSIVRLLLGTISVAPVGRVGKFDEAQLDRFRFTWQV